MHAPFIEVIGLFAITSYNNNSWYIMSNISFSDSYPTRSMGSMQLSFAESSQIWTTTSRYYFCIPYNQVFTRILYSSLGPFAIDVPYFRMRIAPCVERLSRWYVSFIRTWKRHTRMKQTRRSVMEVSMVECVVRIWIPMPSVLRWMKISVCPFQTGTTLFSLLDGLLPVDETVINDDQPR